MTTLQTQTCQRCDFSSANVFDFVDHKDERICLSCYKVARAEANVAADYPLNPIVAAALATKAEVETAAAELRAKGYGVRYYRPEPATPLTLEVTAPYSQDVFEMTLDRLADAVPVLAAMAFAAPPFLADPDVVPTSAEMDEARKRARTALARGVFADTSDVPCSERLTAEEAAERREDDGEMMRVSPGGFGLW